MSAMYIREPQDVYRVLKHIGKFDQETFWIIGLNAKNRVLLKEQISQGGINSAVVDQRIVFKRLLAAGCVAFTCAHNHPSGCLEPSVEDRTLTENLRACGELLEIKLLDHLIIGREGFLSMTTVCP